MEQTMNMMGGIGSMAPAGSMGSREETTALNAFQNTDRSSLVRDLNEATEGVAPGAIQSIVAELRTMGFDAEDVSNWIEILDETLADPQAYATNRQDLIQQGMDPEFLPEQFDYGYLVALRMAFETLKGEVGGMPAMGGMGMMPVQGFAGGGIAELKPIAQALSQMGRNGDTMLAHINPQEAMMLRRMGGSGTINPYTGLPEFFKKFFKSVGKAIGGAAKSVGRAVKKFAQSDIGRMVLTVGLTMLAGPAAYAILGATAPAWAVTALAAGMAGTGTALLGGSSLGDSLKAGLTSAVVAGVGSAAYSGISGGGVNAPYTGPKSYGELFETTQPAAPIEDATSRARSSLSSPSVTTDGALVDTSNLQSATAGRSVQYIDPNTGLPVSLNVSQGAVPQYTDAQLQGVISQTPSAPSLAGQTQFAAVDYVPSPSAGDASSLAAPSSTYSLTDGSGISRQGLQVAQGTPFGGAPPLPEVTSGPTSAGFGPVNYSLTGTGESVSAPPSIYDRATDALSRGYQGAKDVYTEYISPSRGMPTPEAISTRANAIRLADGVSADKAYDLATQQLTPGMISRYAPVAGVGLGVAALSGAFTPEEPPEPKLITGPTGIDLYQANPEQYRPNIYAGQTPVTYQDPNQALYRQQQYAAYNPFFYAPQSRSTFSSSSQPLFRKEGGITETSKFKRKMGAINGPGTEKSDDIPAMLSDGEFVFTARAVRGMGNGSRRKGAKEMYRLMKMLEKKVGSRS
jgi:hypothetical protein